jgi:ABC-type nitrate/sulfonate/bicarbonate transport system substrate-binding protein
LLAATGAVAATAIGYAGLRLFPGRQKVRLGIAPGTQTLWRYLAARKDELLGPLGYDAELAPFADEVELRSAFVGGKVEVIASLVTTAASLAESGIAAQLFLPIAWLREGYPIVVANDSSIGTLSDLRGRRVGTYPLDHPGMLYWRAMAPAVGGVDIAELDPIQTLEPDKLLASRSVDAAILGGVQWANLQHQPTYRKLLDLQTAWRTVGGTGRLLIFGGYIARRELLDARPRLGPDLLAAHRAAFQVYRDNRNEFLDTVSGPNVRPLMTPPQNQAQATYLGYDDVDASRLSIGDADIADHQNLFSLMSKVGVLKAPGPDAALILRKVSAG